MDKQKEFTKLYTSYSPAILKLCLGYTGHQALAEDLLQETFIGVWNNMHTFRGNAKWSTWIYRVAVNTCLSHFRKRKLRTVDIDHPTYNVLADEECNKEQEVQLLYKCISQLAQADRLIISMVLEDTPYEEIASITGITENNLRVKIHRIKKQLTETYNRHAQL